MSAHEEFHAAVAAVLPPDFPWRLEVNPRRRHAGLRARDGVVVLSIPTNMTGPDRTAAWFAVHAPRALARLQARAQDTPAATGPVVKELVNGEGFLLFGQNHKLRLVDDPAAAPIVAEPGPSTWSGVRTWQLTVRRDQASARLIIEWYRGQLAAWLDEKIPPVAARCRVRDGLQWEVRPHREGTGHGTWGRYLVKHHRITMPWIVAQLPRDVAEQIVRHEVGHAARPHRQPGASGRPHGPEWRALMSTLCHDWRRLEAAADEHRLWHGGLAAPAPTPEPAREPAPAGFVSGWGALTP